MLAPMRDRLSQYEMGRPAMVARARRERFGATKIAIVNSQRWFWVALLLGCLLAPGCASRNVNPAKAAPRTGYVDVYTVEDNDLSWDVRDLERRRKGFSEFNPVKGNILRLAYPEGEYELRISLLNRAVLVPATNHVSVKEGMVTPIRVHLVAAGTANVYREETHAGGTVYGRYWRTTKIKSDENTLIDVKTEPQPSVTYAPKDQMSYWAASSPAPAAK